MLMDVIKSTQVNEKGCSCRMSRTNKARRERKAPAQQFDATFKDWLRKEAYQAVPLLIEGAICDGLLDREIILPTKRADQILRLIIDGEVHIGNIEFQTNHERKLLARLLVYHSVLYYDYDLPVYSMIIYPFKTKIDEPPLTLYSAGKERVIFHFD
jgi:hypothetical protein